MYTLGPHSGIGEREGRGQLLAERYEIKEIIGSGGMGSVWRAWDSAMSREVAIKRVELNQRSAKEAAALAALQHANIVKIHAVEVNEAGESFLILELVHGRSLQELVNERGPLPVAEVNRIALQALDALAFAHEKNIIHRDIKPHNLMLDEIGNVKILDFGIAKVIGLPDQRVTKTGEIIGTPQYISPEQCASGEVSPRTDLYLLACSMIFMATGKAPFTGDTVMEVLLKQLHDEPEVSSIDDERLKKILLKAMAKNPEKRFKSASEMAAALSNPGSEVSLPLAVPNAGTKQVQSKSKNKAPLYLVAGISIAGITLTAAMLWPGNPWGLSKAAPLGPWLAPPTGSAQLIQDREVLSLAKKNPVTFINRVMSNRELRKNPASIAALDSLIADYGRIPHQMNNSDKITGQIIDCEEALVECCIAQSLPEGEFKHRRKSVLMRNSSNRVDLSRLVDLARQLTNYYSAREAVQFLQEAAPTLIGKPKAYRANQYALLHFALKAQDKQALDSTLAQIQKGDVEGDDAAMLGMVRAEADSNYLFRCTYIADYYLESPHARKYPELQFSALLLAGMRELADSRLAKDRPKISKEHLTLAKTFFTSALQLAQVAVKNSSDNYKLLAEENASEARTFLKGLYADVPPQKYSIQ